MAKVLVIFVCLSIFGVLEAEMCSSYHVVESGDTLSEIARDNNVSTSSLAELNNLDNKDLIKKGKKICLSDELVLKCNEQREVRSGETLSLIAVGMGMTPPYESALKIAKASDIKDPDKVEVGDIICVDEQYLATVSVPAPAAGPKKATTTEISKEVKKTEEEQDKAEQELVKERPKKEEEGQKKDKEVKTEPDELDMLTGISISPFLTYSRIDAVDVSNNAKGGTLSRPDYGAEFKIMQVWGDYFTSELIFQIERRKYFTNSNRTFDQHGGQMLNFGAGMGFRPFRRVELKVRAFYGDEFYFRAPNLTSLAIDKTMSIKGDVGLYFDIMKSKKGCAGIGGGAKVLGSSYVDVANAAGYHTKNGFGYFGTAYMKHEFKHIILEESFTYENMRKDSELFEQRHSAMYFKGGMTILF